MIDIRKDVPGLWCDDITFCPEKCTWKSCPRNHENIRDRTIPHSFFTEIPGDCPKLAERRLSLMTDEEKRKELTRSSFSTQMAMLGYETNGNPKDMVEVVRCRDCKHGEPCNEGYVNCNNDIGTFISTVHKPDWFCAEGKRRGMMVTNREKEYIVEKLQEALEKAENDGCIYAEIRRPIVFDTITLLKKQEEEIKEKNQRIWELLYERDTDDGK